MKVGILAVVVGALLALVPTAAQASSSLCRAPEKCTAITRDDNVDKAVIATDRDTRGAYSLRCEKHRVLPSLDKGWVEYSVQRGFVVEGDRKIIEPELNRAECVLRVRGHSPGIARAHIALVS